MSNAITYTELKREVGLYLGFDRTEGNWTSEQDSDVAAIVDSGERQLYDFPIDPETGEIHTWSFLTKRFSEPVSGSSVTMPEDFVRLVGKFAVTPGGGTLDLVDEGHIRSLLAAGGDKGKPAYYALVRDRDRYKAIFYPEADSTGYSLSARYLQRYEPIASYGAPETYSELLLQSCLAAAERTLRIESGDRPQEMRYMLLLKAAIARDKKVVAEQSATVIWPTDEAVDDLNVTKAYLKRLVGREFGFGAASDIWSQSQTAQVDEALRTGLRMFYSPPILPGERNGHEWSFLVGLGHIDLVASQTEYDLPEDFARLHDNLTYEPDTTGYYGSIRIVGEHQIRELLQTSQASYRPTMAAVRPKETKPTRWQVLFYPKPEAAYRLDFRYDRNPSLLSDDKALPLGGQPHAQTVVDACLAAVESMQSKSDTARYSRFMERLASSISHDRKACAPHTMGTDYDTFIHSPYWGPRHNSIYTLDPTPITRS